MAKKKKRKPSASKKPKLRGKPLADLPPKRKRAARVKGGGLTLAPETTLKQISLPPPTFAPPYMPVRPMGPDTTLQP